MESVEKLSPTEREYRIFGNLHAALLEVLKAVEPMGGRIKREVTLTPDWSSPSMTVTISFPEKSLHEYTLQSRKQADGFDAKVKAILNSMRRCLYA